MYTAYIFYVSTGFLTLLARPGLLIKFNPLILSQLGPNLLSQLNSKHYIVYMYTLTNMAIETLLIVSWTNFECVLSSCIHILCLNFTNFIL